MVPEKQNRVCGERERKRKRGIRRGKGVRRKRGKERLRSLYS